MIRVQRTGPAPASLSGDAAKTEQDAAEDFYATWSSGMAGYGKFKAYSGPDVVRALRRLFYGKCAYCEGDIEKGTREVEHYRPKGGVKEDPDHPGYWWLAHSWSNLLPTCGPCNKGLRQHVVTPDMTIQEVEAMLARPEKLLEGKQNSFPVGAPRLTAKLDDHDAEQPHLIDPTRSEPTLYLRWSHASHYSVLVPATVAGGPSIEGSETIRCLALNRSGLVEARTKQLSILRGQRTRILEDLEASIQDSANQAIYVHLALRSVEDMKLHCAADQEFSAMSCAFVAAFQEELRVWLEQHAQALAPAPSR